MINQQATIEAVRKIGEGFIALSRALEGKEPDSFSDRGQALKIVATFKCPLCDGGMVMRTARATGEFFAGCSKYPECKGTRNLEGVPGNQKKSNPAPVLAGDEPHEQDSIPF